MEVQNHPNSNEVTDEQVRDKVVAKPGAKYPVRLVHLINGILVIGFVIEVFPEVTMLLRPYVVEVEFDPEQKNVPEYDFIPYMDQMAHFDPKELTPVSFMNASMVAIFRPAQHVLENYTAIIQLKETVANTGDDEEIYKRDYINPKVRH